MSTPTSREKRGHPVTRAVRGVIERAATAGRTLFVKAHPCPIIVLGNQKSGTTAVAALLSEMADLSVTLDLKREMKNPVIDRVKSGELSMADFVRMNKLDFSRDIVKEPSLSPFYRELHECFPRSKFVMVMRDPRDNIRSILNRLKIPGHLVDIGEAERSRMTRAWQLILDGRWLGLEGANYIEMLAQRWNCIADVYTAGSSQMLLLKYEDFSRDKVGELERLARALGLERKNDVSHRVDVQFQPAGDRSVRWDQFYGPGNLACIERICADRMTRFGYAASR